MAALTLVPALAALPREYAFLDPPRDIVSSGADPLPWLAALAIVGTLVLTWVTLVALRHDRRRHGPAYRDLAGTLGLDREERRLLRRVARTAGLEHAGSLLVSRGCFEAAALHYVRRFGERERLRGIAGRLFR